MKKLLITVLMALVPFMVNAQILYHVDDKDNVIDSLKTVIKNLEIENDSLYYEIYSLKSNNDGLPYGTKKLSTPISFENKNNAKFRVFQSLNGYALAETGIKDFGEWSFYDPTVVLVGNYYDGQVVKMKNPMIVGRYTYTSRNEMERTVPVILPKEK